MTRIEGIIVHCSDTPASMDIGVNEIRRWHTAPKPRGNGWRDVGYHYIIRRDGTTDQGRPLDEDLFITGDEVAAHAKGFNRTHIGICLVGGKDGFNFTYAQLVALRALLDNMVAAFSLAKDQVIGHRDVSSKPCPQFDVRAFYD